MGSEMKNPHVLINEYGKSFETLDMITFSL